MFLVVHCLVAFPNWLIQMGVSGCSLSSCFSKLAYPDGCFWLFTVWLLFQIGLSRWVFLVVHCLVAFPNWLIQMGVSGCSLSGCLSKLVYPDGCFWLFTVWLLFQIGLSRWVFLVVHCLVAYLKWLIQMGVSGCSLSGCFSKLAYPDGCFWLFTVWLLI